MNIVKKLAFLTLFSSILSAGEIVLAVAANVSYAMEELKSEFNKLYPDVKVRETLTSSGKLTAQIRNGAPYVIFMAANMKYPEALYNDGLSATKPLVYAQGSLAYLSSAKKDFSKGINLVLSEDIKKIAIANPKTAPYGTAAKSALEKAGIYEKVEKKLVFAESISATVSYALTAADIGFVAKSTLFSDKMKQYKKGIHWEDVDTSLYKPIDQGIILLKNGENNPEAKAFYDFILSDKAKEIFISYGYIVP